MLTVFICIIGASNNILMIFNENVILISCQSKVKATEKSSASWGSVSAFPVTDVLSIYSAPIP